ncbi:hypothetical protein [Hymenobacter volaticus]|uniref:Uncharacterized protein n=1 Tax=Hymenobacter volaticus TaxID=2932254 RepID=A0ABY4G1D6_9BACT|nr:hypothetical protein [Hymenobacter volaticus]UOQ64677.1 hypothetical protein MUN86_13965 [Hymenobacter volaticus]
MLLIGLKKTAGLAIILLGSITLPPESKQYMQAVLVKKQLKPAEMLESYRQYDFSPLWLSSNNESVFGFIGDNYQRLQIKVLTARPDPQQPGRYFVTGKSKVGENVLPFQGTLRLLHVREAIKLPLGLDGIPVPAVKAGLVLVEYELREPINQPNTGVFKGVMHSNWYLNRKGKMQYNNIEKHSDAFANNQCVGTWESNKTKQVKRCNWGDSRIPMCGDLDQGAGEFSPSDKYVANGWQSYQKAWVQNKAAVRKLEVEIWWK